MAPPEAYADGGLNFKRWIEFAHTIERGKLDMLFIADTVGVPGADSMETLSYQSLVDKFEPMTTMAALSSVTEYIGLVATCATTSGGCSARLPELLRRGQRRLGGSGANVLGATVREHSAGIK
jgi:hypothetical protein